MICGSGWRGWGEMGRMLGNKGEEIGGGETMDQGTEGLKGGD